jgi:hypothetical protein
MARLRIETAPEITVYDESFVIKAATGASAPLAEFKNSSGTVVGNIAVDGTLNVLSVVASSAGTTSTSLATRGYVDTVASGINWHAAADFATAAALPTCTYSNGTAGVGATLTGSSNGRLTVDGSLQTTGKTILVKNQATATQNGIYTITAQGVDGSAPFVLTRRSDADNSVAGQVKAGDAIYVVNGTNNAGQGFTLTTTGTGTGGAIVLGTDSVTYTQFTGTAAFTAGAGFASTGNVLDIGTASATRIVVNADNIDLATVSQTNTAGANTTSFISSQTVDSYGRVTGTVTSSVSFTGYATLASPTFTGVPLSTTAAVDTNNTQIATTAYVVGQGYAKLASPTFTGTPTLPTGTIATTQAVDTNTTTVATTAYVVGQGYAKLASPTFTGTPTLPTGTIATTQTAADSTTKVATTAFVTTADNLKANLASPTFTGTVTIPAGASISGFAPLASPAFTGTATAVNLTLTGNLTVSGTTTTLNTETLTIDDNIIILNNNEAGTPSVNAGIEVERGTSTNVVLRWNETTDCWEFTNDGTNYQRIITDTVTNAQTASYTLVLADSGKMIEMGVASANTLTVPPNSSVAFPVGTTLTVLQTGAGQCTLTAGAGVTVNGTPGLKLRTTWSSATLIKRATDTWVALGDMVA